MEPIIAIVLALIGYALGSAKLINQGNEAIVERLGRYHRTLKPGMNFIVPLMDQIVAEDTIKEQYIDVKPQNVITSDNIYMEVDAILYWRITDIRKSFYEVDDLQGSLSNLATSILRENIAQKTVEETNISGASMDKAIVDQLNAITNDWGVQIIRLDIQTIKPPDSVQKSMEEERNAEIRRRATVKEADGEREAAIKKAQGTMTSMQIIAEALRTHPESKEILRYLIAQDYVQASQKLGESKNAKIVFVDPANSTEMFQELIAESVGHENSENHTGNGAG